MIITSALLLVGLLMAIWVWRKVTGREPASWRDSGARWEPGNGLQRAMPDWAGVLLIFALTVVVIGVFTAQRYAESKARTLITDWVSGPAEEYRVWIDGKEVPEPTPIVLALREISHVAAHHSSPVHPIQVRILRRNRELAVVVAQDSSVPREYWVFLDRGGDRRMALSMGEEAGRITTDVFQTRRGE